MPAQAGFLFSGGALFRSVLTASEPVLKCKSSGAFGLAGTPLSRSCTSEGVTGSSCPAFAASACARRGVRVSLAVPVSCGHQPVTAEGRVQHRAADLISFPAHGSHLEGWKQESRDLNPGWLRDKGESK